MVKKILTIACIIIVLPVVFAILNMRAFVHRHENCGYIDKSGEFVIEPQFSRAGYFSEGLAAVHVGGKYGYIDKTGEMKIKPRYDIAISFHEGLAEVGMSTGKVEAEDTTPRITSANSEDASDQKRDRTIYRWGVIDKSG